MKCAGCVRAVENQLTQQPGVLKATVNLVTEVALVECEPGQVDPDQLAEKLTETGFPSQSRHHLGTWQGDGERLSPADRHHRETQQQTRRAAIAILLLILSIIGHLEHFGVIIPGLSNIWFHFGLATVALLFPGRGILVDGWKGLRHNIPNMNTLIGLGTLTAYSASTIALFFPKLGWECFFDEPVMLVGFILLGRSLEQRARGRAATAFQALLALQPAIARLIHPDSQTSESQTPDFQTPDSQPEATPTNTPPVTLEIPAERVKVGEWLQVLPGETIPVDGEVIKGQTTVNESMLTGEALPVLKYPGDTLTAGSLNLSGAVVLKATRTGQNTTLAKIISLVETAQTRKAPIQGLADTLAGYFTYGVMAIASLTFLFWYFVGLHLWPELVMSPGLSASALGMMEHGHSMHQMADPTALPLLVSLKLAIAVLVIACPCALGLATPTAILVGSGIGAERGLLIRGGDILEKVHQINTIVFDKTGTLTQGEPRVTDCLPTTATLTADRLLQLAATVESGTQHPLARAIQQQAQQQGLALLPADAFQTEPGLGVAAIVEGQQVVLGTAAWLIQQGISLDSDAKSVFQSLEAEGKTLVYVGLAGQWVGTLAVQDSLRPDAIETVTQLRQLGLRVMLLTGDRQAAAQAIAQPLGLASTDVIAQVRPDEKGAAIAHLQSTGQRVGMVGDGINDAPALAQADVGIALNSGTDVAIETAGIVLMRDRLKDVVESIRLSRATFNKIRQNLFWAFAYNALGIPVAAGLLLPTLGIVLSPATAGALMAFSSVSVVTNSLLLRRVKF
ncbi:MAG: heavy metal translocating P-type ATPase [Oculatellaceae cyanobacterium Prado106]|jgi:Cu2+-exporting ATPase|nr:heavy metal translocating P-type ATPase [Oculatellaceae cyanobacterium Prado106]